MTENRDRRRPLLVNPYEVLTAEVLTEAARAWGARVSEKVRVADALKLEGSGISDDEYSYGLKAHFDFVVVEGESLLPCFAVEFDGPHHQTDQDAQRRDELKAGICERLGMPLLRISVEHLEGVKREPILAWLVDVWFTSRALAERALPADEFRHWLTAIGKNRAPNSVLTFAPEARYRIFMFLADDAGGIEVTNRKEDGSLDFRVQFAVPYVAFHDDPSGSGLAEAETFVTLTNGSGLTGESRCRAVRFDPIRPGDVAAELAILDAANKIEELGLGVTGREQVIRSRRELDERKGRVEDWDWFPLVWEDLPIGSIETSQAPDG